MAEKKGSKKNAAKTVRRRTEMANTGVAGATDSDVVDMPEAIALLKTTRATFYRWLRAGKIKGMKVGRQWRFYRKDVERILL